MAVFRAPIIPLGLAIATLLAVFSFNAASAAPNAVPGETSVTET